MASVETASILVDVTAVPADRRGVGRYVDELVAAVDRPVLIACQLRDEDHYRALAPQATILPQRGIDRVWARLLWEQWVLPGVARRAGAGAIFSPHYTIPLLTTRTRVVTFHDATFFSDPGVHTPLKKLFFRWWIRVSARLADAIIVPSAATARELDRFVHRSRGYRVVYHGVDPADFHRPGPEAIADAAALLDLGHAPWIAFLGTIEPRKNIPALIEAYSRLVGSWNPGWGELPTLALAGGRGWATELDDAIAAVPSPGLVRRLGYIDLSLMSGYLGGSVLVAYPSLGEGFGLPVLEGMASGAPVLTTPRLALPEVGGDAVAYSEPDAASLHLALERLAGDPELRAELGRRGRERAALFTWAASAEGHLRAIDEALERGPDGRRAGRGSRPSGSPTVS